MSYIPGAAEMNGRIKIPFHFNKAFMMISLLYRLQVGNIFPGIVDYRHHSPENGTISPEKINK